MKAKLGVIFPSCVVPRTTKTGLKHARFLCHPPSLYLLCKFEVILNTFFNLIGGLSSSFN